MTSSNATTSPSVTRTCSSGSRPARRAAILARVSRSAGFCTSSTNWASRETEPNVIHKGRQVFDILGHSDAQIEPRFYLARMNLPLGSKAAVMSLLVALDKTDPLPNQNGTVNLTVHRLSWAAPVTMWAVSP